MAKEAAKVSNALTFEGGAFSADSYNGSAAKTVKIPTTTEHIAESGNNLFHTASRARAAITGAASSIVSSNLTENKALISNASGKVAVSAVTSTELGYLSGVTSKVQDQLKSITDRIDILEALGLSLVTKDGKTYVQSAYNFYSKGGLTAGGIGSGGGGGTGGGSNVSYKGELSSGMLLGTITIDGLANKIYGPSALSQLSNDAGYITASALDGYLPKSGGVITGDFGAFGIKRNSETSAVIRYDNTNGILGYLGFTSDGCAKIWGYSGTNAKALLHEGNYSSYALPIDGGTMNGDIILPAQHYIRAVSGSGYAFIGVD
ncbi:MAG: hypothetical protein J6U83_00815, partial [Bacteroidales bacterium]|nr:hypothetical protein [Bacteroidales bacterium]